MSLVDHAAADRRRLSTYLTVLQLKIRSDIVFIITAFCIVVPCSLAGGADNDSPDRTGSP
jgi:hypothetical protein